MIKRLLKNILLKYGYVINKNDLAEKVSEKGKVSFSQCGEDLIIDYIFKLRNIDMPSYIDIGAHDPYFINNTAIFHQRGCRGINIEANPLLLEKFHKSRPEDLNISAGISNEDDELDFYIMRDNTLSTFSKADYDFMVKNGKELLQIDKVKLFSIESILNKYCNGIFPDLLSIDVEGMDVQIIKSIDFSKSAPKIICVEAAEYSPIGAGTRREELIDFLVIKGYYEYANTNLNAIMIKNEFWYI